MAREMWRRDMDMSITRTEFLRLLPAALGGLPIRRSGNRFCALEDQREIIIELSASDMRRIGALVLPRLNVSLSLLGGSEGDWVACQRRFDQAYQRGGG